MDTKNRMNCIRNLNFPANSAFIARLTRCAIGPTIIKLKIFTIQNKQPSRQIRDIIIQKRPVPPSPNDLTMGIHQ
ncbi:hypothetical protein BpHYR1_040957 [Brachionus plicatilis]|uniref:Uncharacterized protein n=1 Tax=Brachionus plicatilis TaxID=10195 RepID=A0A3M7T4C4_BRAPC|nr:hypothetical protein BpHYR1_040957 [Brachionus plicatilis]